MTVTSQLSPRESQILRAVCEGRSTKEIASAFGIAESTVNWHVANTLRKLNAASRAEAVFRAYRAGFIDDAGALPPVPEVIERPSRLQRFGAATGRWAIAAALLIAVLVGLTGISNASPLFRVAPIPTFAPPTLVPPATGAPRP